MKSRIIAAVLLILFSLSVSIAALLYSKNSVEDTQHSIEKLRMQIKSGEEDPYDLADRISRDWKKKEHIISTYTPHREIEEVSMMIEVLPQMVQDMHTCDTLDEALYQCEMILAILRHLATIEVPYIRNLL